MVDSADDSASGDVAAVLHRFQMDAAGLQSLLERIAVFAAEIAGDDSSAGIMVIVDNKPATVAVSDKRTTQVDDIQYGEGEGPCLEAAQTGERVRVLDTGTETRWPAAVAAARRAGLRSSVSIPLDLAGQEAVGALNVYGFGRLDLDDYAALVLDEFAAEASRAVWVELRHAALSTRNEHLHAAMATRRVIDQALGIIIAQNRCSPDEAFNVLRRASQNRNVKINQLAAELLHQTSGTEAGTNNHWRD